MSVRLAVTVAVAAISLGTATAAAHVEMSNRECSGNYTDGSQYANNVANLVSTLSLEASFDTDYRFGMGTVGNASGVAMCYADCDAARCRDFLRKATDPGGGLTALCPRSRNASLLVHSGDGGCLRVLRYGDAPFFLGTADTHAAFVWQSGDSAEIPAADVAAMRAARWRLLSHLAEKAVDDGYLATGNQTYAGAGGGGSAPSQVVYGLAQCTRDLDPSECTRCLANLLAVASGDDGMANATRGSVRGFSCYLRFQVNEPIVLGGSGAAAPAPQPPPATADRSGAAAAPWTGTTRTTMTVGLVAAAASTVVLLAFGV